MYSAKKKKVKLRVNSMNSSWLISQLIGEPSQPPGIMSRLKETFIKRYSWKDQCSRYKTRGTKWENGEWRVVRRIYGMKYSWKGHKDKNRHKNIIKRSGQAQLVYVFDINRNIPTTWPRSGELRTQKLKSHLLRTQSLNVLPLKSAVVQYIARHAMLTARNFFLAYFYPSGPFTCIFSKTSPNFFLCWLWLTPDPV